ncbi:MAG TPA: hypothetical protein VGX92_20510 [Pyrinomonadaceae bacterium]|jgi:uncharacterized membrane protein YqiK|nr:hypothetical protein [Pyrinomonadaceae bacterium]
MATAQSAVTGSGTGTGKGTGATSLQGTGPDAAETVLSTIDESTKKTTGISLFHILTLGSIGASIALFFSGNKQAGIFVGLWPPTFQALKSAVENSKKENGGR